MPLTPSELTATGKAFIDALSSLNVDDMLSLRTPDCQAHILPASLGRQPMSNTEFATLYKGYLAKAQFSDYSIAIQSIASDAEQGKVVLHARGTATTLAGPWQSEYIFILSVVPGAEKPLVSKIEEFVDSRLAAEQGGKIQEAIAKAAASASA